MVTLSQLFLTFARVGALTFGGGYAMLPILQREVVERHGWARGEELLDYYAVGQCTPGIIAVNTATFVGARQRGVPGAVAATLGVIAPSVLIILAIASLLEEFSHLAVVQHAFAGIRVAVCALVLRAVVRLWKNSVKDWLGVAIFAAAFFLTAFAELSPVWLVLAAVAVGLLAGRLKKTPPAPPAKTSDVGPTEPAGEKEAGA